MVEVKESKFRGARFIVVGLIIVLILAGLPFIFELGSEEAGVRAAKTWIVDDSGDGNFTTIQDAIDKLKGA